VLFALTLVGFAAVSTRYLGVAFNHTTRFVLLLVFLLFLLARGYLGRGLTGAFGLATLSYLGWICATVLWSQVPDLSAPKAVLQIVITVTFVSAGYVWTRRATPEHAFSAFCGMTLLVGVTGVLGAALPDATLNKGSQPLYRGLAYNPNLLGIMVLMSVPWTVWFFQNNRRGPFRRRMLAHIALFTVLAVLLLTGARSSILAVGVAGFTYLFYAGFRRYAAILGVALVIGTVAVVTVPDLSDRMWAIFFKGTEESGDVLYSRRQVWEDSLAGAEQGDLIGVGYGVSAGFTEFSGGLSAEGYGREKGNTALAIWEELGQIGLALYIFLLVSFFGRLMRAAARVPNIAMRTQIGIVLGTAFGLVINSQFEAWFVAPAAPASPFFWSLLGCGVALAQMAEQEARMQREIRQQQNSLIQGAMTRGVRHVSR
jgi:O-antigen ligase